MTNETSSPFVEESDLPSRSKKRFKDGRESDLRPNSDGCMKESNPLLGSATYSTDNCNLSFHFESHLEEINSDVEEENDSSIPTILFTSAEKRRVRMPWLRAIIVKAMGKNVGYNFLYPRVKAQWKISSDMDCIDVVNGFFVFRFHSQEDFNKVMCGGSWFVSPYYLTMRRWELEFDPKTATISTTPVWTRLPGLPLEYFDRVAIKRIGNTLGRVDIHTEQNLRGKFAPVCVQVDLNKPLIPRIKLGSRIQKVEYKSINVCFACGLIGHDNTACPTIIPSASGRVGDEQPQPVRGMNQKPGAKEPAQASQFGPCMFVRRRNLRRQRKNSTEATEPIEKHRSREEHYAKNLQHANKSRLLSSQPREEGKSIDKGAPSPMQSSAATPPDNNVILCGKIKSF